MEKFIIRGGKKLEGEIKVSGAKNVAMKVILAGLLTEKPIYIRNIPLISSVFGTANIVRPLGVQVKISSHHTLEIRGSGKGGYSVPLEAGGFRTATMVLGPLLVRFGKAIVPNPGGCRLGRRPIERHIEGLRKMGAKIKIREGFFYAEASKLYGTRYRFKSNTHTGTEALILAAVLAKGETILENAAAEPEVDDLIRLLNLMGAKVKRIAERTIVIQGVKKLKGAEYEIMPDRNEVVTFAVGAIASFGKVIIDGAQKEHLKAFLTRLEEAGASWQEVEKEKICFYTKKRLRAITLETAPHPGFMTDWQAPWALLMTQAKGISVIHERIFEDRFGYVNELKKMGAKIEMFNPKVSFPKEYYNFNWSGEDRNFHAIKIYGPKKLHNAVVEVMDLRAGATLVLGAIIAQGESIIYGVEHIDRGYEQLEKRLQKLKIEIKRVKE